MFENDEQCNMRILSPEPVDRIGSVRTLKEAGVRSFYLRFTLKDADATAHVLDEVLGQLA